MRRARWLALVFGVLKVLNVAHGELLMLVFPGGLVEVWERLRKFLGRKT